MAGVIPSNFSLDSVAGKSHLFGVHDDDLVSEVPLRTMVDRFVLSPQVDAGTVDDFAKVHFLGIENMVHGSFPFEAVVSRASFSAVGFEA